MRCEQELCSLRSGTKGMPGWLLSAIHTRAQSLFPDLAMTRVDGSLRSPLARLGHIDVLVITIGHDAAVGT